MKLKRAIQCWCFRAGLNILVGLLLLSLATLNFSTALATRLTASEYWRISKQERFGVYSLHSLRTKLWTCSDSIEFCLHTLASTKAGSFSRSDAHSEPTKQSPTQ